MGTGRAPENGAAPRHALPLTRDRLDELYHHAADLGVDVEWADLGDRRRGECWVENDVIVLSLRLTRRQATAVLAHELAHRAFGDTCSTPAGERRAWEYAAALLITPADYHWAEWLVGPHAGALAVELEVTPRVIEAWRRWWGRTRPDRTIDATTPGHLS